MIEPKGFAVICKDEKLFSRFYEGVKVLGAYERSLANGSDTVNLKNCDGDTADSAGTCATLPNGF